jgi:hypothetical protein
MLHVNKPNVYQRHSSHVICSHEVKPIISFPVRRLQLKSQQAECTAATFTELLSRSLIGSLVMAMEMALKRSLVT